MSTTIDSLALEIQSNSSGAVGYIERLAGALEKIKKSTITNTAVNNLKSLTAALKELTPVSSNANKLGALAESLKNIAAVGSLRGLTNQLKELPGVMNALSSTDLSKVAPQLERVSEALTPLASVRGKGFNDAITGLKKLDEVSDGLDSGTIDRFVSRIRELDTKLGPVSTKLIGVGGAIKEINSSAKNAGSSVGKLGDKVNATTLNMSSFITVAQGVIQTLRPIITLLSGAIGSAMEWDGIEYQFGNAFGEQADEYYDKITRVTDALNLNKQTFMEVSAMSASMLKGFGVNSEDSREMGVGYAELAYDIWAAYNNVYKTLDGADGAISAIRSAISGEVEPIRRAGFTIVDSQLAITAANHGLAYSTQKATEEQKSYLRYLTLVEQAQKKGVIGTYAKEMKTAEGLTRTLAQQLKSLSQAFGSLFIPILVEALPYVQAFVELLGEGISAVASFFGIEIQPVDWGKSGLDGIGESAEDAKEGIEETIEALKELKNATLGIDELNVISPPSSSGGGSGGGSESGGGWGDLDVDSLWNESIFDSIDSQVDEIKGKLKDWLPLIEAIGFGLGGLAVAKLLSDLTGAISKMDTLSKAIAGIATATLEFAMVFTFADNYLEEGKITDLIGQAISTALGSYLLYKTWGDKGLVVGIGVAIAAQLAAITLNLAEGEVEMDDPRLWIQSAFTSVLGAGAGGWLAYKGIINLSAGKGIGLGLLAGVSLSLAAITIGDIAAKGETTAANIMTGLGSVVAAAGFGFTVGGVHGAVIGAAVALGVNIVGALVASVAANAKEDLASDLESRFGSVELTDSEVRVLIGKLTPEWVEGVDQAALLREGVADLLEDLKDQEGALGALEWQVSVGLALTESENEAYKSTIDSFITTCQSYVSERGYALEIGLSATTSTESIIESANGVTTAASTALAALGKQLQDTVNAAYEDGLLDIDELEAIQNIRNDMQDIVNALNSSDIDAELDMIKMQWSGVELTPDSYQTMMDEWNDVIQNDIKPKLEETVSENLKALRGNIAYLELAIQNAEDPYEKEALQAQLDTAKQALQDYMDENPLEGLTLDATIEAFNFGKNTLQDAFADELENAKNKGWLDFDEALEFSLTVFPDVKLDDGDGEVYANISALFSPMYSELKTASESLPKEARKALESMLVSLQPMAEDLEKVAAANTKVGKTVPKSVREGLSDYNELKALAGDIDGINYMIGEGFSTDSVYLNTLSTVKNAGNDITGAMRDGLLNNIEYVHDDATGLVTEIKSAITGETVKITPTLIANLGQMGIDLGDALSDKYTYVYDETTGLLEGIVDSVTGNELWVNSELKAAGKDAAGELNAGLKNGLDADENGIKKRTDSWGKRLLNNIRDVLGIHSPSTETYAMGQDLSAGLKNGLSKDTLKDKMKTVWTTLKNWWTKDRGSLSTYTPSIGSIYETVKERWNTAKNWWAEKKEKLSTYTPSIGDIKSKVSTAWTTAKNWWTNTKSAFGTYTPNIGDIKSKVSTAWTTAKNWWANSKSAMSTYTPSIGSIKDKVSSAWTTARNWWSNSKTSMSTYTPSIGSIKTALTTKWNEAKKWWKDNVKLSIPSLSFKVTYTTSGLNAVQKAVVNALNLNGWPKLSFAANGGMFDAGSLIWAGEAGAEVVANAGGGRTGVMNVQQMQEAVYEGVYAAVVAAMRASGGSGGGSQDINVYLDGRQIVRSVEKNQRERGATIVNNPNFAY